MFLGTLTGDLIAVPLAVEAQQRPRTARIAFLSLSSGPTPTMDISPGLRELGWIEGQNIVVEYRWAANREDQLPALAAELVRLKVDVIVTSSTPAAQAAKRATTTIPIVVTFAADPVGSGLVASLARPGGNITGLTTLARGLIAKRLELLKAVASGATSMAILWQPGALGERAMRDMVEETQVAGRTLGLQLRFVEARRPEDFEPFPNPMLFESRERIVAHAAKSRLPAVYPWREAASVGGLGPRSHDPRVTPAARGSGDRIVGPGVSRGALCADAAVASGSNDQVTDRHQHAALVTCSQWT